MCGGEGRVSMRCGFFTYSLRRAFANVRFVITNRPGRRFRDKHGGIPSCSPLKSSSPLSHDNRIAVIVILLFVVSSLSEWSRYCTVFARHVRRYNSRFLIGSVFVRFLFFCTLDFRSRSRRSDPSRTCWTVDSSTRRRCGHGDASGPGRRTFTTDTFLNAKFFSIFFPKPRGPNATPVRRLFADYYRVVVSAPSLISYSRYGTIIVLFLFNTVRYTRDNRVRCFFLCTRRFRYRVMKYCWIRPSNNNVIYAIYAFI